MMSVEQSLQSIPAAMPTTRVTLTLKERLDLFDKLKESGLSVRKYASQNAVHHAALNRMKIARTA